MELACLPGKTRAGESPVPSAVQLAMKGARGKRAQYKLDTGEKHMDHLNVRRTFIIMPVLAGCSHAAKTWTDLSGPGGTHGRFRSSVDILLHG